MATYAQLQAEAPWRDEYMPPSLVRLGEAVRKHFGLPAGAIGSKGDNAQGHMSGYHRSRRWIQTSRFCTNRTYSVTETPGNRSGGDPNWLAALDISAPPQVLLPMCQRLDAAVRAGRLEKVVEWYGNIDGDQRVDGWDNIRDRAATSDSSHLWHLHLSFDRGLVGEDHSDVLAVLTGTESSTREDHVMRFVRVPDGTIWVLGIFPGPDGRLPAVPLDGTQLGRIDELVKAGIPFVQRDTPLDQAHYRVAKVNDWAALSPAGADLAAITTAVADAIAKAGTGGASAKAVVDELAKRLKD